MKQPLYSFVFFVMINLCLGCDSSEKKTAAGNSVPLLDFEEFMGNERELNLSEIADTIEYLELKTPDDLIVSYIQDIISVEDFWVIRSREGVDKFTKDGVYVTSFGRRGQGPGDYNVVFGVDVDRNRREILISDHGKIIFYDYDGKLIREEKWGSHLSVGFSDSVLSQRLQYMQCRHLFLLTIRGVSGSNVLNW